ncbi:hypothetical protein QVD17_03506 [Tagetes erecta]|uniref:Uncharacterized protein n=1 Tax=Tagetes erecta TaxID=13708 RepID=A0AAD8LHM4_TARER|nr:hypothetical protein QVD17_03506 [Tagetes erecta]
MGKSLMHTCNRLNLSNRFISGPLSLFNNKQDPYPFAPLFIVFLDFYMIDLRFLFLSQIAFQIDFFIRYNPLFLYLSI